MSTKSTKDPKLIGAATWTGRQQAFALISSKCTLAQAECLQKLRETRAWEHYGLTWDEFCPLHAGISRSKADHLIQQLKEFGADYFRLSNLVNISDQTYRAIAPQIHGETIHLLGEELALIPENAAKIRAGIQSLRVELHSAQVDSMHVRGSMGDLHRTLNEIVENYRRRASHPLPGEDRGSLGGCIKYAIRQLNIVLKEFDRPAV